MLGTIGTVGLLRSTETRRAVLRGALTGSAGLAAAALLGCSASKQPAAPPPPAAASSGKPKLLNEEQQALNDPSLPYPVVVPEPDTPPVRGGIYKEGYFVDFGNFDTIVASSVSTQRVPNDTGEGLLRFVGGGKVKPQVNEIESSLATSWELSPDGLTVTFKLTDKAKFHNKPPVNGRAFTAEDARLVYERNRTATGSVSKGFFDNVSTISAVNPTTLQIKLKAPQADFLTYPATRELVIYAMELIDSGALAKSQDSIGTGPWILTEAIKTDRISYVKNKDYWRGEPYLDGALIRIMTDQSGRLAALRTGQIHYGQSILRTKREADLFHQGSPDFNIIWSASAGAVSGVFTMASMRNPKWQDERVRQAVSLLFNREKQLQIVSEGIGYPYVRSLPWGVLFDKRPTAQADLGPWLRYDPAEGKRLLQAATGQTTFAFEWIASPQLTATDALIGFAVDSFKENGITITPRLVDAPTLASQFSSKQFPDTSAGTLVRYTTDNYYKDGVQTGGSLNPSSISDKTLDEWCVQQSTEPNPQKRRELLRKIWDHTGQKAYFPFEQAAGSGPAGVWAKQLRNFWGASSLNGAVTVSNPLKYMAVSWLEK